MIWYRCILHHITLYACGSFRRLLSRGKIKSDHCCQILAIFIDTGVFRPSVVLDVVVVVVVAQMDPWPTALGLQKSVSGESGSKRLCVCRVLEMLFGTELDGPFRRWFAFDINSMWQLWKWLVSDRNSHNPNEWKRRRNWASSRARYLVLPFIISFVWTCDRLMAPIVEWIAWLLIRLKVSLFGSS